MPILLPVDFYPYFWDVSPKEIDLAKNDFFIIERLLEWGDIDSLVWLKNHYGREKILMVVKGSNRFSPRTANFYSNYFNIPRKDMRCFQTRFFRKLPWSSRN